MSTNERAIQLPTSSSQEDLISEKDLLYIPRRDTEQDTASIDEAASSIIAAIKTTHGNSHDLQIAIQKYVHQAGG